MNDVAYLGRVIIFIGLAVVMFGIIILLMSKVGEGKWWPLPGDIVIQRGPVTVFFPIMTMIILSIIMTLLLWVFLAFRR
jgi:hypothetical protein